MKDLFYMGGPLFMSLLTLIFVVTLAWGSYHFIRGKNSSGNSLSHYIKRLAIVKSLGLFAMITGILGQLLGLYAAFAAIEEAGDISKALFFGGLKVSMISIIYGVIIFLLSYLIWFILDYLLNNKLKA